MLILTVTPKIKHNICGIPVSLVYRWKHYPRHCFALPGTYDGVRRVAGLCMEPAVSVKGPTPIHTSH